MEDKIDQAQRKLKGISNYLNSIVNAVKGSNTVTETANSVPVANTVPVANVVPIVPVANVVEATPELPTANVVVNPPHVHPHHHPKVDIDHDGIEDQTPEQVAKYLDNAFEDIKKIFRW